jgi:MFS family permease
MQMLIARIGIGIGEAGGNPPAQALVAEYFPADARAKALTVFVSGAYLGGFLGGIGGGLLGDSYSWRTAFIILGIPGLVFGILILATLREPPTHKVVSTERSGSRDSENLVGAILELFGRHAFRHLMIAVGILYFSSQGAQAWHAAFFMRAHGLSLAEAGGIEGFASLLPVFSVILAGYLTDRLYRRDPTWQVWLPMIATALSVPLFLVLYLAPEWKVAALAYVGAQTFAGVFSGIFIVSVQSLVWKHERSLAAAMVMFSASLIGLGAGPFVVGLLSDILHPSLGEESLRWSLVLSKFLPIWGLFHLWRAAQTFRSEIKDEGSDSTAPASLS